MPAPPIRFDDGAAYEQLMGVWSRAAGGIFLDWLAPRDGLNWIDVGCGNGAFTELLCTRHAPAGVEGIDPSDAQLEFARSRPGARLARFRSGDAMALPFADGVFDAAVMTLVIVFVPDPARAVAEMARVVAPGGSVSSFIWDVEGGGFPLDAPRAEMRAMSLPPLMPPSADAARLDALRDLWSAAGLRAVETRTITVQRRFADFDEYWATCLLSSGIRQALAALPPAEAAALRERTRARLAIDDAGRITCTALANAVKGVKA